MEADAYDRGEKHLKHTSLFVFGVCTSRNVLLSAAFAFAGLVALSGTEASAVTSMRSATTISATLRPGAYFAASANGSVIAYQEPMDTEDGKVYVWQHGKTERADSSLIPGDNNNAPGKGIAVSGDGRVVAYSAEDHGHSGTGFYDTASHARTFLKGYELGSFLSRDGAQLLSSNGQDALLSLGPQENKPSTYGIYDRATGQFTRLPQRKGVEDHGVAMSTNGQVVIYSVLKDYAGEVGTVIYNVQTHKSVNTKLRSENLHWLSESGNIALIEDGQYEYDFAAYNLTTGAITGPQPPSGTLGNGLGFLETPSLTGNGETVAFLCTDAIYTYDESQNRYSMILNQSQELGDMIITANGSQVIYDNAKGNGLNETPTSGAPTASTPPTNCERKL